MAWTTLKQFFLGALDVLSALSAWQPPSALRVPVDPVKVLNLGRVLLIASLAFFAVGFGISGEGAAFPSAYGRGDDAENPRAQQLTPPDCSFVPIGHPKLSSSGDAISPLD